MTRRGNVLLVALAAGIVVVAAAAPKVGAAEEQPTYRWAVGYADGAMLRRDLGGGWALDLAAGPDDDRHESDGQEWFTDPVDGTAGPLPSDDLDTRESGWVRVTAARRLAGGPRAELALSLGAGYTWRHEKSEFHDVSTYDGTTTWRLEKRDGHEWRVVLGLRQSFRLTERLSCETGLGVSYRDSHTDRTYLREEREADGSLRRRTEESGDEHRRSFFDFGWSGTASLAFLFWF